MTVQNGPDLELQIAIVAALKASTDVQTLVGNPARINPEQTEKWPGSYIVIGEGQNVPDPAECIEGSEIYLDIHVWSRADTSFADAKRIAATVLHVITNASLTLTQHKLVLIEDGGRQHLRDPDGVSMHVVLTVRALTEPAA